MAKLRKAQKIELKWVTDQAVTIAREYVNRKNYEIQQLLTKQVRDVYLQYDEMRDQAIFFKKETARLTEKLVSYESRIADLVNSVNTFNAKHHAEENFIKFINEDTVQCNHKEKKAPPVGKLDERALMKNPKTFKPF